MAKVSAPLFSFGARGQLAKSIVYFPWKGIDAVRQHVIPANPQSAAQTTQRGYMEAAVDEWHLGKYTATDKTAWDRYAGILANAMSGFNAFVQSWIARRIAGVAVVDPPFNAGMVSGGPGLIDAFLDEDGEATSAFVLWGYSKTAMSTQLAMVEGPANTWIKAGIAATVGSRVYCRFFTNDGATPLGYSGIFQFDVV